MADPLRRLASPRDAKGRIIAIFGAAVLVPSLALSYVSVRFATDLARGREMVRVQQAEGTLKYVEKELEQAAQSRAAEMARLVGTDRLFEGRPEAISAALEESGLGGEVFESLHLEASSPRLGLPVDERPDPREVDIPREVLGEVDAEAGKRDDAVPFTVDGKVVGILRFRFRPEYVERTLVREYFERDFPAEQGLVVRVGDAGGAVVYETAPTPQGRFEVHRRLTSPSLRGLQLSLRYKGASIEQEVRRWRIGSLALIAFIDLMLGAGLYLVYSNVRRELHLSRLKSDFVANVSHELKTPLALIRLFAETLELGRVPGEEKARQYYRVINKESQRLTQLINNILDFSRIEAGRKEYRFAPTDLGQVAAEVIEAYRFQIEQQGFALEVTIEPDLPELPADREAVGQALLNLVNNAIKYSAEERHLAVRVWRGEDELRVAVSDRGIGVAKGEQRKIFEKFYRAEDSLVHRTKGSGLGLPLVRHIMGAHGGRVEVESTPGRGSTFTLAFPLPPGEGGGGAV